MVKKISEFVLDQIHNFKMLWLINKLVWVNHQCKISAENGISY